MKKFYKGAALLCSIIVLFSCSKKNEIEESTVSQSTTSITTENNINDDNSEIEEYVYEEPEVSIDDKGDLKINGQTIKPVFIDEFGNEISVEINYETGELIDSITGKVIDSEKVQVLNSSTGEILDSTTICYTITNKIKENKEVTKSKETSSSVSRKKTTTNKTSSKKAAPVEKTSLAMTDLTGIYDGRTNEVTLTWKEPDNNDSYSYSKVLENGIDRNIVVNKGTNSVTLTSNSKGENEYTLVSYSITDKKGYSNSCKVKAYMFTSIHLPLTGTAGGGNKVTCSLEGVNFTQNYVSSKGIKFSSNDSAGIVKNSKVNVIDDEHLTFDITIPKKAGIYEIVVSCGNNTIKGNLEVKQSPELLTIISDNNVPVAIVTGYSTAGIAIGLGLVEQSNLHWAVDGSFGFNTKFENIISKPSKLGTGSAEEADFSKDIDGKDNFEEICKVDKKCLNKDGSINNYYVKENYPLFYAALTYGTTANVPSKYADGWFIPSAKEMCDIYRESKKINRILKSLNGDMLNDDFYWTSTQNDSKPGSATAIRFQNAAIFVFYTKSNAVYARCVREFPEI